MKNTLKIMGKVLLALVIVLVSILLVIYVYNRIKIKQEEPLLANPLGQMVEVDGHMMCVYEEGEPYSKDGVRYHFDRCPVAEFAKAHGYLNIMPAFCNCDYPAMEYINAALIRKHTCANSDVCDYLIVGDESKTAKEHPKETDEQGYWYNVGT